MDNQERSIRQNITSHWPLPDEGVRIITPASLLKALQKHPLTCDCVPHAFGYYPRAQGHRMQRSRHQDHLLIYVVEGKGTVGFHQQHLQVHSGELVLLRKGTEHYYQADPADPWSIYWAHFDGLRAEHYIEQLYGNTSKAVSGIGLQPRLQQDFQDLLDSGRDYQMTGFIYCSQLLRSMLSFSALLQQRQSSQESGLDLKQIHRFMLANLHQKLDLDTLVDSTSQLSRFHFCRVYKKTTGQSPIQAFLHMKIARACYLLDVSGESIAVIGQRLGYDDPYYFSRLFRKITGSSPSDYRKHKTLPNSTGSV